MQNLIFKPQNYSDERKMILDFTISNFRSIREPQTISFEATKDTHLEDYYVVKKGDYRILKMAIILGANASGKSNIVKAFGMLTELILSPCETKSSKIEYDKFALDKDCATKESVMKVSFICGEQKYRYEVQFNNEMVSSETLLRHPFGEMRPHKVFERTTDTNSGFSTIKWGDKFKSKSYTRNLTVNLLHNRTVFGAFQKSNIDIPWMKEIVDFVSNRFVNSFIDIPDTLFYGSSFSEQILYLLTSRLLEENQIDKNQMAIQIQKSDIGVSDFLLEKETKTIPPLLLKYYLSEDLPTEFKTKLSDSSSYEQNKVRFIHKGKDCEVPFDFEQESGGTQRFYELSGLLLWVIKEPHFLAIDELECRLHPDLYTHFITTFLHNAKESQIVFTTHSREFLADKDMFRDDIVWFTEKNDEGATELYSLADFGSDVLRDSSNRYNFYRAGRLGGVPRLGDTYIANPNNVEKDGEGNKKEKN